MCFVSRVNLMTSLCVTICIKTKNYGVCNVVLTRWHGCESCCPNNRDDDSSGKSLNQKREHTRKISEYIRQAGFSFVEMWECEWRLYKRTHTVHNSYTYSTEHKYCMTEQEILGHIVNGDIFGAVEVDISVPAGLKDHFQEMPPVFKNTTISEGDIGDYMRDYLAHNGKTFKDTRYLIGSMFGTKILIITPLLQWYLAHGLTVTKVYQVIEFSPRQCFGEFVNGISSDRRAGDRDPNMRPIAEVSKLKGRQLINLSIKYLYSLYVFWYHYF